MTLQDEYVPSRAQWVRDQVKTYEESGGRQANTLWDTGLPVIIVTMRGNKSGKVRKIALMRVAHNGEYALVASMGGAPKQPVWYYNLVGPGRRRLPAVRRLSAEDRAGDPGLRGYAQVFVLTKQREGGR